MSAFTPVTLRTERLTLRWLDARDLAAQFSIHSSPAVARYGAGAAWTEMAQAEAALARDLADYASGAAMRLAITLTGTGEVIGNCSLYAFDANNRRADIGYALAPAHWGQGYLREALRALIEYGFGSLNLNRIEADTDPRNSASIKALEALRFQKEGYLRERWLVNGEVCDTVFFGLLRSDWRAA